MTVTDSHGLPPPLDGCSPEYLTWKTRRLNRQSGQKQANADAVMLSPTLDQPSDYTGLRQLCQTVKDYGFCCYQWKQSPDNLQQSIDCLNSRLGLTTTDTGVATDTSRLSLLKDHHGKGLGRFVPYSARAMNWHTDGYYNAPASAIRCFNLHCVQPAACGGELVLMDPELLLIALYDHDPELVEILSHPSAMTLPANRDDTGHDRPDVSVPLLFAHADRSLGMRFTTRSEHIRWRTPETQQAAAVAIQLLNNSSAWHTIIRLDTDQGLVTRNVLHKRSAFTDSANGPGRQMLRGRYHQRPSFKPPVNQPSATVASRGNSLAARQ